MDYKEFIDSWSYGYCWSVLGWVVSLWMLTSYTASNTMQKLTAFIPLIFMKNELGFREGRDMASSCCFQNNLYLDFDLVIDHTHTLQLKLTFIPII